MSTSMTGGCQCGAVRYECAAEPLFTGNCHCQDCQRASGGAYVPALAVPTGALEIKDEVKYYGSRTDSGNTLSRGFCPDCGARLFGKTSGMPELMLIIAGTLDDPSCFKPATDIFTSGAQPWDYMNPSCRSFPSSRAVDLNRELKPRN